MELGSFSDGRSLTVTDQYNIGATDSAESPFCGVSTQRGVWYKLSMATAAQVSVSTCDANFDTRISVYSGDCDSRVCRPGLYVTSDCIQTVHLEGNFSPITIYIRVEGFEGATGTFDLTVSTLALHPVS